MQLANDQIVLSLMSSPLWLLQIFIPGFLFFRLLVCNWHNLPVNSKSTIVGVFFKFGLFHQIISNCAVRNMCFNMHMVCCMLVPSGCLFNQKTSLIQ